MCVVFICKVAWFEATVYTALLSVVNENYSETTKKKKKSIKCVEFDFNGQYAISKYYRQLYRTDQ